MFPFAEGPVNTNNVSYLFAPLWGSAQTLMLFICVMCIWHYRNLLTLLWLTVVIEVFLRMIAGTLRPMDASYYEYVPPGSTGNLLLLAITMIVLALSLRHKST